MDRFLIQFAAVFVTALVVFGTDSDVLRAAPLGLFAAMLASVLVTTAELVPVRTKR